MNSYWKIPQELLVQNNVRHCKNIYEYGMLLYPPQTKFGGVNRNHPVRLSIRPSMYHVSATPPKPLIGFLWNFTHL
jgi:hypothetical protein